MTDDLQAYRERRASEAEDNSPHMAGPAVCLACGHKWTAVSPSGVTILECPSCHLEKGVYEGLAQVDGPHWACGCGNQFFLISPQGIYCPLCGVYQDWGP